MLIECSFKCGQIEKARELYDRLKMRIVNLRTDYFVEADICAKLDVNYHSVANEEEIEDLANDFISGK